MKCELRSPRSQKALRSLHPLVKPGVLLAFVGLFLFVGRGYAAPPDSTLLRSWRKHPAFQLAALPLTFTSFALPTLLLEPHTRLSKYALQEEFQEQHRAFDTQVEDQLRYAPIVLVYGLNLVGVKGKHAFAERSILLAKSMLLQHVLVTSMKKGFQLERPEGGGLSFPSSHTARAFAAATFMHHEYKHLSPWYSISAYSFAVATGALRVVNNHHWLPDVLVGAGLGILSTNLVYATHQYRWSKWRQAKKRDLAWVVLPVYQGRTAGIQASLLF